MDVDVEDQPEIDEILEDSPTPVDQFLTDTPPQVDSPEIFAEEASDPSRTPVEELRFDDNTPLPDDFGLDDDAFYSPVTEEEIPAAPEPAPVEAPQVDLELSEPDEWTDILDEFEDLVEDLSDGDGVEEDVYADDDEGPLDMDSQFALQAEAMGIDLSGTHESLETPAMEDEDELDVEEDLDTLLEEPDAADRDIEELLEEEIVDEIDGELEAALDDDSHDEADDRIDELGDDEAEDRVDEFGDDEVDVEDHDTSSGQLELIGEPWLEADSDDFLAEQDEYEDEDEQPIEHVIPPMTEEEQTINMQIDQDLLAIAIEDEDGFASTMILPEDAAAEPTTAADEDRDRVADEEQDPESGRDHSLADTSAGFETIIMEGEFVRSDLELDKLAADAAAAASLAGAAAAEREAANAAGARKVNYGMVAGVVILVLLLIGQVVHQSRNTLATIPAFNDTVGPLYRAIGQPLSPDWDITGWRFEATRGSTDEGDEALTIFSRVANKSDQPLPYPLISVSLTDRFEETIGNRVLDPADYLSNDLDPRKLVQPGTTFNAAITIKSPAGEATGFKLNVCYRESGGKLRCAIDDFK
jgi:hypothetical protein